MVSIAPSHLSWNGERHKVRADALLVPTRASNGAVTWASSNRVYFGDGWLSDPTGGLLAEAYGDLSERRLIPWAEFSERLGAGDENRTEWQVIMTDIEVPSRPRIVAARGRRAPPLYASWGYRLEVDTSARCPLEAAGPYWQDYLRFVSANRTTATKSGQLYDFESVSWIDGMERENTREAVVRLMLEEPSHYVTPMQTRLSRQDTRADGGTVPALWMFALKHADWPVVPTNNGVKPPSSAWLLSDDEANQ